MPPAKYISYAAFNPRAPPLKYQYLQQRHFWGIVLAMELSIQLGTERLRKITIVNSQHWPWEITNNVLRDLSTTHVLLNLFGAASFLAHLNNNRIINPHNQFKYSMTN